MAPSFMPLLPYLSKALRGRCTAQFNETCNSPLPIQPTLLILGFSETPKNEYWCSCSSCHEEYGNAQQKQQHDYLYWEYPEAGGQKAVRRPRILRSRCLELSQGSMRIRPSGKPHLNTPPRPPRARTSRQQPLRSPFRGQQDPRELH